MRISFLFIPVLLSVTENCFSQSSVQKKQEEQRKAGTKPPTVVINPVVQPKTATNKTLTSSTQYTNSKVDSIKATLLDVSFSVGTARDYAQDPGTNKAAGTHWSCVLFDENDRAVANFQDNSNSDEHTAG